MYIEDVVAGDMDRNGIIDLVIVADNEVIVLSGAGNGTFQESDRALTMEYPKALAAGDLNRDGHLDLAVVGYYDELYIHLGDGDGTLGTAQRHSVSGSLVDVAIADLTGDANPDLVACNVFTDRVMVLAGDGQGNVEASLSHQSRPGRTPQALVVGDWNGDGRPDIATANKWSHDAAVMLGETRSTARAMRFLTGSNPSGITQGDFNGDGRADLAVANAGSDDVSILLNQGTLPNLPPSAQIDWTAERDCSSGGSLVALSAEGSVDLNSTPGTLDDVVFYEWLELRSYPEPHVLLGTTPTLQVPLPVGEHLVRLKIVDTRGELDYESLQLELTDLPPELSLSLDPVVLWPPNHRLVEIEPSFTVTDECPGVEVTLESIISDEPDDAPGPRDGHTTADVQSADVGTADLSFQLRAERDGTGDGRTYSVTYRATDAAGNMTLASATVMVPHDQGGSVDPVELSLISSNPGTRILWGDVPGASHYNVIRGDLDALREKPNVLHLGRVECIEGASVDTDTAAFEDAELPASGETFFYLVEYFDGSRSSYGSESAPRPRHPQSGDCQ
jgi:FG-GAP-like repeat/FG-GAP repeat